MFREKDAESRHGGSRCMNYLQLSRHKPYIKASLQMFLYSLVTLVSPSHIHLLLRHTALHGVPDSSLITSKLLVLMADVQLVPSNSDDENDNDAEAYTSGQLTLISSHREDEDGREVGLWTYTCRSRRRSEGLWSRDSCPRHLTFRQWR
jgi:hypothetical protein